MLNCLIFVNPYKESERAPSVGRHLRKLGLAVRAAAGLPDAGGYVVDFALEGDRRVVVQLLARACTQNG